MALIPMTLIRKMTHTAYQDICWGWGLFPAFALAEKVPFLSARGRQTYAPYCAMTYRAMICRGLGGFNP